MTNDIDWEVKMEALDASLPRRLERAAQMAERSDNWTDTERLMPATGVADLIWEAHSEILGWRALNKLRQDSRESAKDEYKAGIAAALEEASYALMECPVWCDRQEYVDDGWRNGVADARRHISRHIRARAAELKEDQ